jgi:anti-anti-sigma factor
VTSSAPIPDGTNSMNLDPRLTGATVSAIGTRRVFRPDPRSLGQPEEHHRASFSACRLPPSTVLVTVAGDVDATNSCILTSYVERQITGSTRLMLDLKPVDFFGTAGIAALHHINVICPQYGVEWVFLAGQQTRRLLRICDPGGSLPLAKTQSGVENLDAGARDRDFLVGGNH